MQTAPIDQDDGTQLSPELRAIVACVRGAFGLASGWPERATVDSEAVIAWAVRHGVGALVHSGLAAARVPLTADVRVRLRTNYLAAKVCYETFTESIHRRALGALAARGLEPIVLKGGALAYLAYPEPVHRSMGDLDLLLPDDQLEPAAEALRAVGFAMDDSGYLPPHHLPPYRAADSPLTIELHHHLMPEEHPYTIDLAGLRARARVGRLAGLEARVPSPEDALFHACVHLSAAHRYRVFPLRGLIDVLAITTRWRSELDWQLFLGIVERSAAAGAVYWPLLLGRSWLGAEVPDRVLARLAPPAPVRRLLRTIARPSVILEGRRPAAAGSYTLQELLLTWSLQTGRPAHRQARTLLGYIFPPPDTDGDAHGPGGLRHAAYVVSPARIGRAVGALARLVPRVARSDDRA